MRFFFFFSDDDDLDEEALVATLYDDDEYEDLLASAGHRRSSKRARTSEATLHSLPEVTAGRSREGEDCAVCLQAFRADEKLRAMPCSHALHQHCISEWLRRNAVCPLCRHQLPPAEEDAVTPTPTPTSRLLASRACMVLRCRVVVF
ncbi:hypothetical protein C2845_PM05G09770 [Panicum miliaceum]|uniref:RING-type domain-containing protein n=1 Tax=Panicum miliaceum TaxID=4540 RepID=A0A3L6T3I3_PANMI|nr:hypothetical protein C2845_PM05G09770 [Panicum miliaceum]